MSLSKKLPPRHIAIVMDGNGRWAKERGWARIKGHEQGAESVQHCIDACLEQGVEYLTLYAFSSENWKRSPLEVKGLMTLLEYYLTHKIEEMHQHGVRFQAIGRLEKLPRAVQERLRNAIEKTADCSRLYLTLALNYGARDEIVDAVKSIATQVSEGKMKSEEITQEVVAKNLYTAGMPDPDLFVRTSGELRISNFLLWQLSYTEIYVTPKLWPDFKKEDLIKAIEEYQRRERRFGAAG